MAKPLVNKEKWSQNDIRLLVILCLTIIYPVFAAAFFALFMFLVMPLLNSLLGPHIYWLTAALLWVFLCAVILPCFRDTQASKQSMGLDIQEGPLYPTKQHAVQPFVMIEEGNEKQRQSLLTNKSRSSSRESIEKGMCEEKADKESLEKSKENLGKSSGSLEKGKITQSGEFLNECIDSLGSDKPQEEEAECEVHAEEEIKDADQDKKSDSTGGKDNDDSMKNSELQNDELKDNKDTTEPKKMGDADDEPTEVVEPIMEQYEKSSTEAEPENIKEGNILETMIPEEEEMTELEENKDPVIRRKALPTLDTSRTSGYYECSMPTPKSAGSGRPESNMVFLFVNPDIASAEEDIIVNHQGEVQEDEKEK